MAAFALPSSSSSSSMAMDDVAHDAAGAGPGQTQTNMAYTPRKFPEISIAELPEVLAVAKDSMDPESDLDTWTRVLEAVQEQARQRQEQRDEWEAKLEAMSANLASLRATQPRASWRSPNAHSQQLAGYGQRTLEMAKQIAKLEAAISRTETDVRECKAELERLDRGEFGAAVADEGGADEDEDNAEVWGEQALGRHTLALTMFRQLGFQPLLSSSANAKAATSSSSSSTANISTLFARSDTKSKVTPFKVGDVGGSSAGKGCWSEMSDEERVKTVNAMWEAIE